MGDGITEWKEICRSNWSGRISNCIIGTWWSQCDYRICGLDGTDETNFRCRTGIDQYGIARRPGCSTDTRIAISSRTPIDLVTGITIDQSVCCHHVRIEYSRCLCQKLVGYVMFLITRITSVGDVEYGHGLYVGRLVPSRCYFGLSQRWIRCHCGYVGTGDTETFQLWDCHYEQSR